MEVAGQTGEWPGAESLRDEVKESGKGSDSFSLDSSFPFKLSIRRFGSSH